MSRLLAVFNILSGSASIAGLYVTLPTLDEHKPSWMFVVLFVVTAIFVAYVLFVPGNRIEANVAGKLQDYQSHDGVGTVTKVSDEFNVAGYSWKEIPFPHPFKEPPQVELIKIAGMGSIHHCVKEVTVHKFVVVDHNSKSSFEARYRWIATGAILPRVERKKTASHTMT